MPRYDFKCAKCDEVFEATKKMSEPCPACTKCGGETRVHFGGSSPSAHFTGGGWAKDNYASVKKQLTVNQMLDRNS